MLVQGTAGVDTLSGGVSADTIIGGLGADRLTGGGGSDLFKVSQGDSTVPAPDQITDFQADDRLDFGLVPITTANAVGLTATSLSSAISQAGAAFASNQALRYVAIEVGSNLHIFASDSDGGQTASLVTLTGANFSVLSLTSITGVTPVNPNLFTGTEGSDSLVGTAASDTIHGVGGADTIVGGLGADLLSGGAGADYFKVAQGDSTVAAPDQITDFQADDRLDFGLEAATTENTASQTASSLSAAASQASAAFAANSALRYVATTVGSNLHMFASDADGGQTASLVTMVNYGPGLSLANFTGFTPVNPNLFVGTAGADTLIGTATSDTIQGNGGADMIIGGLGADRLSGGAGADYFKVAQGDSTVAAPDQITDFQADDRLDFGLEAATTENTASQTASSLSAAASQASAAFAANSALRYVATTVGSNLHMFASDADGGQTASLVTMLNYGPGLSLANFTGFTPVNPNLFVGTAGADTLIGTATSDTIQGNGGADTIIGGLGADLLSGGAGADYFKVAQGDSTVAAPDQITDFQADDRLDFGLAAATTENTASQTAGSLSAAASQASAAFAANSALRYVATTVGSNLHMFASDADGGQTASLVTMLNYGPGLSLANFTGTTTPQFIGGDGADMLTGTAGADFIQGNGGDDSLSGEGGADTIGGGDGSDTLTGGQGADIMTGGAGDDLFRFAPGDSTPANPDQITDFTSGDRLDFGIVQGTATNYAENSAATVTAAQAQADSAFGANSALRFIATQVSADVVLFTSDSDGGEVRSLATLKGVHISTIDFGNITGIPVVTPPADVITGTFGPDLLMGTAAQETLLGGTGADTIWGGQGRDVLSGGADDDMFKVGPEDSHGAAPDRITDFQGGTRGTGTVGGTGDRLDFGHFAGTATNYMENSATTAEAAVTQASVELGSNSALRYVATQVGADVMVFASGPSGWAGPYPTNGMQSYVTLQNANTTAISFNNITGFATTANQVLDGTTGRDTLLGGGGRDSLVGGADNDLLSGDAGADILSGDVGQDTLIGGLGNDVLTGGANEDRFVFAPRDSGDFSIGDTVLFGSADTITDFQTGIDTLSFGNPATAQTGGNYRELATIYTTYADAEFAAKEAFAASLPLMYVVTQVGASSYLFVDTHGAPYPDTVVYLQGVALSGIAAADIV